MVDIVKIKGVERTLASLEKRKRKHPQRVVVSVGYTAKYALGVHENIEMKGKGKKRRPPSKGHYWDPPGKGQAKFLEQPARDHRKEIISTVKQVTKATGNMEQGLIVGGLRLQRFSQPLVPVDTGNLKASAFTKTTSKTP